MSEQKPIGFAFDNIVKLRTEPEENTHPPPVVEAVTPAPFTASSEPDFAAIVDGLLDVRMGIGEELKKKSL